jgi:hypothetical protein
LKIDDLRTVNVTLVANGGDANSYTIETRELVACLLSEAENGHVVIEPATLPVTVKPDILVTPEKGPYRVREKPKNLADALLINFRYTATNADALKDVKCPEVTAAPAPVPKPSGQPQAWLRGEKGATAIAPPPHASVRTVAAQLSIPPGISGAVASEIEGMAGVTGISIPKPPVTVGEGIPALALPGVAAETPKSTTPMPTANQQPIIVAPAQPHVVVVAPRDAQPKKKQHRLARLFGARGPSR